MSSEVHTAFELQASNHIKSLNVTVETYQHKQTGCKHYHLASDNPENVLLIGLKTVPQDSTGVAHILEHTVLCGSKKYPVRDPFFMMIRRSLNTFMNAFTSSDWTAYPFASLNKKDFSNLTDVYLDSVFFPSIDPLDFAQEGHRLEFDQADNPESDLVYKGVVYNEMKGAMSSPVSFAWRKLTSYVYPGTTYSYNSGGDPAVIPNLSYDALMDFYKTHYHPGNAVFFTFGDIPASEHHAKFQEHVLQHFEAPETRVHVNDVTRYSEPQRIIDFYPAEEDEKEQHVTVTWLLGPSTDMKQQMAAILMSSALLDNSASPMRFALENTTLGKAPSPLCGLEESNKEMVFICGLEGVDLQDESAVEQLILDTLEKVAQEGIDKDKLDAVLHQMELSQKEITGGSYPYGLQLILDMLPLAVHEGDPIAAICLDDVLDELRESIKNPEYLKQLVQTLLLENPHRVTLSLKPDKDLKTKQELAETQRLSQVKAAMSDEHKRRVVAQAQALKQRQEKVDDESVLPKVGIEDVPDEMSIAQGDAKTIGGIPGETYVQGTNGLVYEQVVFELPALSADENILLSLYSHCLTELGAANKDYLQMQAILDSHTGGISCYPSMRSDAYDETQVKSFLVFSGKALAHKSDKLIELLSAYINEARFDELDRIKDLVTQWRIRRENSITGNGHSLAMLAASQGMSPLALYRHQTRGLVGLQQIRSWDDGFSDNGKLQALATSLKTLHEKIASAPKRFLLISDEENMAELVASRESAYATLISSSESSPLVLPDASPVSHQAWLLNTQVNFCSLAYKTVAPYHDDGAALMVLGGFLKNGCLHRTIREQGGAYGGGAGYDADSGSFRFYSYRDPRLQETFTDFERSIDWLLSEQHGEEKLEEAILGVISSIDKPSSPAGEAKSAFHNVLFGRTAEKRQALRKKILNVTVKDMQTVAEKYMQSEACKAVITNQDIWQNAGLKDFSVEQL